jgi:hypothetical protein
MIKTFIATGFSCLAVGSLIGYAVSELTRQPQNLQAQTAPVATVATATPKPLTRTELEQRYIKAVTAFGFRVDQANLVALTDKQLNDEVARLEALLRAKS